MAMAPADLAREAMEGSFAAGKLYRTRHVPGVVGGSAGKRGSRVVLDGPVALWA